MIFLTVRDSDVFMCSLYELLPKFLFEGMRGSIYLYVFEILIQLELIKLLLLKLLEGILDAKRRL